MTKLKKPTTVSTGKERNIKKVTTLMRFGMKRH